MRELILNKVRDIGCGFASRKEDEELDEDTLRDAITTGHITPDEIAEAFVVSVLEALGLENNIKERREDRIEASLRALEDGALTAPRGQLSYSERKARRAVMGKIVDAIMGRDGGREPEVR
jgi:hypothetical protein